MKAITSGLFTGESVDEVGGVFQGLNRGGPAEPAIEMETIGLNEGVNRLGVGRLERAKERPVVVESPGEHEEGS
jgi:hypothetical protein